MIKAKAKFVGKLARVEHKRAGSSVWEEIPINKWHAIKLFFGGKLTWQRCLQHLGRSS